MAWVKEITLKVTVEDAFPVGTIYFSANSTNPAATLGAGTWIKLADGKLKVGTKNLDVWCWQRTA
jgi:hypothetical protein